jgi:hypothetical protein
MTLILSLLIVSAMWLFINWAAQKKKKDSEVTRKREVDRLLSLDDFEKKIS